MLVAVNGTWEKTRVFSRECPRFRPPIVDSVTICRNNFGVLWPETDALRLLIRDIRDAEPDRRFRVRLTGLGPEGEGRIETRNLHSAVIDLVESTAFMEGAEVAKDASHLYEIIFYFLDEEAEASDPRAYRASLDRLIREDILGGSSWITFRVGWGMQFTGLLSEPVLMIARRIDEPR